MIESISPPPSPEDAAAAVVDFANFRAERYAALADLYYEGIFLPKKAPVAIALYENALKCGAEFDPPKKLNVLQRICDFYLQRECYAKATIYLQALSAPQIFSLAQLYHTNNVIDCAVCCYEAFIRSPDAKDADDELRIRVFLIRELLKRSRYSDAAEYLCSSGKVIAELPDQQIVHHEEARDQLDAGERLLLAEYFFCRGRFAEVIASLSSLCSDPASRDAVHDPRREVLLFCAYCRCNDPAAAAEIFRLIPCNMPWRSFK